MDPNNKVLVLPNICGIEIDLSATLVPSVDTSMQPFYNTLVQNSTPTPVYTSPSRVIVSETGAETRSGMQYTQTLRFQFPSNDPLRIARINDYLKARYIYIKLSNGMVFFFGRNDYAQNSKPKAKVSSNEKLTQITYTCKSIFPLGFTNGSWDFQFPEAFPLNFYNL